MSNAFANSYFFTASVGTTDRIRLFSLVISTSWTSDQDQVFESAWQHAVSLLQVCNHNSRRLTG